MKLITLLFISFSLIGTSYGQSYQSIYGDSSTTWSIIKVSNTDYVCSDFFDLGSDTTIASNTYKILDNYGYVREDSVAGKVWFYDDFWSQEFLVMDLSLNATDTFMIYDWNGTPEVFTVDSVNFISGKKHVYINANVNIIGTGEPLIFVEGSGPNGAFNYHRNSGGTYISSFMMCHSKNDIKVLGNTMFMDSCEVCWVGLDELDYSSKELVKVCDYLGRETPVDKNTPLLYYYSDGTIRKVFIVE